MLSVLMVSFSEGLQVQLGDGRALWQAVLEGVSRLAACRGGAVWSGRLFPGGSGVACLSPGWSPGVLALGASAGWVCKQLHLYALG